MSPSSEMFHSYQAREQVIPPVFCPFPLSFDRQTAHEADERISEWIERVGLFQGQRAEVAAFRIGTFAALCHPDAADFDRLMLAAMNICAFIGADDQYCDEAVEGADPRIASSRLAGILPVLEDSVGFPFACPRVAAATSGDAVTAAYREVICSATRLGTPAQVGRLRREITCNLLAMSGENAWRLTQQIPPSWEYLQQRSFNGAMACLSLIDVVGGYELNANDYDDPGIRSLTLAASMLIMLVNDLYSAPKEAGSGVGSYSFPPLLSARRGWPLERCMTETAHLHDRYMQHYLQTEHKVARHASPAAVRYLTGLRNWIRGNLEWHATSGRFHQRDGRSTPTTRRDHRTGELPTKAQSPTHLGMCPYCCEEHTAVTRQP
jgi:2-methylisoborneol synthase